MRQACFSSPTLSTRAVVTGLNDRASRPYPPGCAFTSLWFLAPLAICGGLLWLDTTRADLVISAWLYDPATHAFPQRHTFLFETILHNWTKYAVVSVTCLAWANFLLTYFLPVMKPRRRIYLFLGLALALAPGLVAGLKLMSGRHCPWDVIQFGGFAPYLALLDAAPAGIPPGHCFPAGHATAGFSLMAFHFVGWSWQRPTLSRWGLALGVLAGLGLGFARVAQGAHFLSHVLWSGLLCWIVIVALYFLILHPTAVRIK